MTETEKNLARYHEALHAVQSGVAAIMDRDPGETAPKHLRVGVNSSLCNSSALAKLLIAKGVITEAEYIQAIADEMEAERARYETRLTEYFGTKITLR